MQKKLCESFMVLARSYDRKWNTVHLSHRKTNAVPAFKSSEIACCKSSYVSFPTLPFCRLQEHLGVGELSRLHNELCVLDGTDTEI